MTTELDQLDDYTPITEEKGEEKGRLLLPALLFCATVLTTLASGALQQGLNIFQDPSAILRGYPFSIAIIAILGTHELGHFFAAKRHRVATTVPYFIPGPPLPPMVGTFGAVIRIKSPIIYRTSLIDIGAAGPIAGFIVSVVVTAWGLHLSPVLPTPSGEGNIIFGSSLIFNGLSYLVLGPIPAGYDVFLHPVAFAGWIGFFITCMNLLPIGQLDGGHISFAVFDRLHKMISIIIIGGLVVLGLIAWPGWLVWAVLVSIIGVNHPPVYDSHLPLDGRRRWTALVTLLIFCLTIVPTPVYVT